MTRRKSQTDTPVGALLEEGRRVAPSKAFAKRAVVNKASIYRMASKDPVTFWERQAKALDWFKPWRRALQWKAPHAKWFAGGKLNVAYNCLDRHVNGPLRTKAALIWEGESGESRTLTYWDLYREVNRFAAALSGTGSRKGIGSPSICR